MHYFLHIFSERTLYPLSLTSFGSSPKGTPLRYAGNLPATAEAFTRRGKVARSAG